MTIGVPVSHYLGFFNTKEGMVLSMYSNIKEYEYEFLNLYYYTKNECFLCNIN